MKNVLLQDGTLIKTYGIEAHSQGVILHIDKDLNKSILLKQDTPEKEIVSIFEGNKLPDPIPEGNRLAVAFLKLEQWVLEYETQNNTKLPSSQLVITGSSTLSLTILPGRVSHDLDLATQEDFKQFCWKKSQKQEIAGEFRLLEINAGPASYLLKHITGWETRASYLTGSKSNIEFAILHPLDTLSQKLLRADASTFEEKDKPDIIEILKKIQPDEKTLTEILIQGASRYYDPNPQLKKAAKNNTQWLLKNYFPHISFNLDILRVAKKEELKNAMGIIEKYRDRNWDSLTKKFSSEK
jgi:hypothetical protein